MLGYHGDVRECGDGAVAVQGVWLHRSIKPLSGDTKRRLTGETASKVVEIIFLLNS